MGQFYAFREEKSRGERKKLKNGRGNEKRMYGGQQGKEERIEKFLRGPSGKQGKVERTEKFLKGLRLHRR